jgi:hypothetical protein
LEKSQPRGPGLKSALARIIQTSANKETSVDV